MGKGTQIGQSCAPGPTPPCSDVWFLAPFLIVALLVGVMIGGWFEHWLAAKDAFAMSPKRDAYRDGPTEL